MEHIVREQDAGLRTEIVSVMRDLEAQLDTFFATSMRYSVTLSIRSWTARGLAAMFIINC